MFSSSDENFSHSNKVFPGGFFSVSKSLVPMGFVVVGLINFNGNVHTPKAPILNHKTRKGEAPDM